MALSFSGLAIVAAVAFVAPLVLGLAPAVRLPAVVLEIVLGIAIGPDGLGWVHLDRPIQVMSLIGLAFLLLLAGLEVEFHQLRGRLLRVAGLGFVLSFVLALAVGLVFAGVGVTKAPLLVAIMLSATSLGVVIPVLKDTGQSATHFGQLVLAGASIADVATIVLLSCAAYAASDEFHQTFVPSRTASLRDVMIDVCGASLAVLLYWLIAMRRVIPNRSHPNAHPA